MAQIFFKELGKGFPIVLVHGFCESHEIWCDVGVDLSAEFRVLMPDLPGFGKSPLPDGDLSLERVADILNEWLDSESISHCIMIGHSLGGYITLAMANKHPQRLTGFGLFNSSALADSDEKKANRDKLIGFIRKEGVALFIKTFVPSLFYPDRIHEFRTVVERIKQIGSETNPQTVVAYATAMKNRPDHMELLTRYHERLLLIAGEKDQNVPLEVSRAMAGKLESRNVHILPDTAHMGMYEQRKAASEGIATFARRMANEKALS